MPRPIGLFLFGSVVAGFAPNEGLLILGRILQGASAGMLQPLMTQIVFQVFPAGSAAAPWASPRSAWC